jgi:hypothetical protein
MERLNKYLAATFLSAAMILPGVAQAMEIQQFDKMMVQDQRDYVSALIVGAQTVLIKQGKSDDAAKVKKLFTEIPAGAKVSLGLTELDRNLDLARIVDSQRVVKDRNAWHLDVEDVMFVTLKANGIDLPGSFLLSPRISNPNDFWLAGCGPQNLFENDAKDMGHDHELVHRKDGGPKSVPTLPPAPRHDQKAIASSIREN